MNMINEAPAQAPPEPFPLFKITHKITREDNRAFEKFMILKYRLGVIIFDAILEIILIYLSVSLWAGGSGVWWIFALWAALDLVFLAISVVKRIKANRKKEGRESEILFYENCFVDTFGGKERAVNYADCEAYEYGGRFIIMVRRYEGYVFAESDFGNDTDNFREFLRRKLGWKFRKRKN